MSAVATTTREDAERLTERIRLTATNYVEAREKLEALLKEAQERAVHEVLGFASWTAYLAATFADQPMVLPTAERREIVGMLAAEGMSTRAIAPIVGVSDRTVSADMKAQVRNDFAPAPLAVDTSTGEITETAGAVSATTPQPAPAPAPVTGLDGKTYTRPAAPVVPQSKRRPLADAIDDAAHDVTKAVERLARLLEDDRFPQNAEKVATRNRGDLLRAAEALAGVLDRLAASAA